jgi:ribosome-binding ATPase YchF (GTP1/OBG family)
VTKDALQIEAGTWAAKAAGLRIVDAESGINASYFLRSIKGLRSEIQQWFAPHVEAAMETKRKAEQARKALVDELDKMEAPLVAAEGQVKRALLVWETEQEQARQAEERRLQAEAQAQAEALTLAAAAALELEATAAGDAEMLQEAQDILSQPIVAPVVSVTSHMPKVQGVTYRDQWKAHPDINLLTLAAAVASGDAPLTFLTPNLTAINQFARATQGTQSVAGVRFFNDRQIAARG